MRSSQSYLDEIAKLRERHTLNFMAEKWVANDTVRVKISNAFDAYNRAVERESKSVVAKQSISPYEFKFFVVNDKREWVARSRSMRGAYLSHKRLSKNGATYTIEAIPENHPARIVNKMKGIQ